MKRSASISIFFSLMLANIYLATASNGESTTTLVAQAKPNDCVPVGRIDSVQQGKVEVRREGRQDFQPAVAGTPLCHGDDLQTSKGAKVTVLCADAKTRWDVPDGVIRGAANGCPQAQTPRNGDKVPMRNDTDPRIPDIISKGPLPSDKPKLCWKAAEGATSYSVSVSSDLGVIGPIDVSTTEVIYPGSQPLKPGVKYLLTVTPNNGEKSAEDVFWLDEKSSVPTGCL